MISDYGLRVMIILSSDQVFLIKIALYFLASIVACQLGEFKVGFFVKCWILTGFTDSCLRHSRAAHVEIDLGVASVH